MMDNTMEDYYRILHFLRDFFVDREYPLRFNEDDDISALTNVERSEEYTSTHEYSYKITNIISDKEIVFKIPNRKYDTSDRFEMNIALSEDFTPSDIKVSFSESPKGSPKKHILTNGKCFIIENGEKREITECKKDTIYTIVFQIKDTYTTLDKKVFFMSALQSICFEFGNDYEYAYLSDVTFRTDVYQRTLEDLDQHLKDGENHILSKLSIGYIPEELLILIPKCAAAYTFLQWWEAEGRAMGDGTELSRNYYDRLIAQIDASIEAWLDAHPEVQPDEINLKMLGYTWVVQ